MSNPDFRAQIVRIGTLVSISLAAFLLISCGADDSAPTTSQLSTSTPMPTETETPKADLVVESVQVDVPPPEVCDDWEARVGVLVTINNQGEAASGPFAVRLNQRYRKFFNPNVKCSVEYSRLHTYHIELTFSIL